MIITEYEDFVPYTPKANGNNHREHPVVLEVRPMNAADAKRFRVSDAKQMSEGKSLKHSETVLARELGNRVRNVENMSLKKVKPGGETETIPLTTGEEFSLYAPAEMRGEVFAHILKAMHLEAEEKKS